MSSLPGIAWLVLIWCMSILVQIATKIGIWSRKKRRKEASNLREKIAAFCHDFQWSGWMRYLFKVGTLNKDGTWTMPKWAVDRWVLQANTPYIELSEDEKENDRREADRILELMR